MRDTIQEEYGVTTRARALNTTPSTPRPAFKTPIETPLVPPRTPPTLRTQLKDLWSNLRPAKRKPFGSRISLGGFVPVLDGKPKIKDSRLMNDIPSVVNRSEPRLFLQKGDTCYLAATIQLASLLQYHTSENVQTFLSTYPKNAQEFLREVFKTYNDKLNEDYQEDPRVKNAQTAGLSYKKSSLAVGDVKLFAQAFFQHERQLQFEYPEEIEWRMKKDADSLADAFEWEDILSNADFAIVGVKPALNDDEEWYHYIVVQRTKQGDFLFYDTSKNAQPIRVSDIDVMNASHEGMELNDYKNDKTPSIFPSVLVTIRTSPETSEAEMLAA